MLFAVDSITNNIPQSYVTFSCHEGRRLNTLHRTFVENGTIQLLEAY